MGFKGFGLSENELSTEAYFTYDDGIQYKLKHGSVGKIQIYKFNLILTDAFCSYCGHYIMHKHEQSFSNARCWVACQKRSSGWAKGGSIH